MKCRKKHAYLKNSDVTAEITESRCSFLTENNRIESKLRNRKNYYFIKYLNLSKQAHPVQYFRSIIPVKL